MRPVIDAQHYAALAFLAVDLEMGFVGARCDLPVHVADIVPLPVFPYLLEVESLAAKHRSVEAAEGCVDQVVGSKAQGVSLMAEFKQLI